MSGIEPTWYRGMYGCPEDMYSRSAVEALLAAERERIAQAIEAVDPLEWALAGQHAGTDAARIARTPPQ